MTQTTRTLPTLIVLSGLTAFGALALYFGSPALKPAGTDVVASPPAGGSSGGSPAVGHAAPTPAEPPAADADGATKAADKAAQEKLAQEKGRQDKAASVPPAEEPAPPAFDVVRVEPSGEAVIAGRAAPGATVELLRDGTQFDRVIADQAGLFAMTPKPLPPGSHELALRFTLPNGQQALSRQSVTVVVAENRTDAPVVALTAPGLPTVVLSNPSPPRQVAVAPPPAAQPSQTPPGAVQPGPVEAGPAPARLSVIVETVETEEGGKLFVSGRAAPGATVRLYLNDSYLASGTSAQEGRLSFTIAGGVTAGDYKIRLDDVDPVTGSVKSRAEVPFNMPRSVAAATPSVARPVPAPSQAAGPPATPDVPRVTTPADATGVAPAAPGNRLASNLPGAAGQGSTVVVPEIKTTVVSRGDSLWRISKRVYGQGVRFTVIFAANQNQIRNPRLIYPGQTFVLPGERT